MSPTMPPPKTAERRPTAAEIEQGLLQRAAETERRSTFCPSEVARVLAGGHPDQWGPVMLPLRRVAVALAQAGRLVIYRKGKPADPNDFKGVYRLGPSCID